jgi:phenylpyruvate tautomerase PptA (4-oxalocrotonate tautomerase family)
MPYINVKLIEDVFTPDQKREMIEGITDVMVSIEPSSSSTRRRAATGGSAAAR